MFEEMETARDVVTGLLKILLVFGLMVIAYAAGQDDISRKCSTQTFFTVSGRTFECMAYDRKMWKPYRSSPELTQPVSPPR